MLKICFLFIALVASHCAAQDSDAEAHFEGAATKEECSDRLLSLFTPIGEIRNEEMILYTRCVVRALGLHLRVVTDEDIAEVDRAVVEHCDLLTLACSISYQAIIEELRGSSVTGTTLAYPTTPPTPPPPYCLQHENDCLTLPDGNYPACYPKCQEGVFISCTNAKLLFRDCSLGTYWKSNFESFSAKLVYDPVVKRCELTTPDCRRELDKMAVRPQDLP